MIERIKEKNGNYIPCEEVLNCLDEIKKEKTMVCIGEIGVDIGATAIEIIKKLSAGDTYYYFDFDWKVHELAEDFKTLGSEANLIGIGNTNKARDSYTWSLIKLREEFKRTHRGFDLVYLDGAHDYLLDGSATAVLKEMMNPGGILIFDDVYWTISKSPTLNPSVKPSIRNAYTDEQIETCMIEKMLDCIMDTDARFARMECTNRSKAIYCMKLQ